MKDLFKNFNFQENNDYIIKVTNNGWFIIKLTLIYRKTFTSGELLKETRMISSGSEFNCHVPFDTDFSSVYLVLHAIGGSNIINTKIEQIKNCTLFNIWGTSLFPRYSKSTC